VKKCITTLFTPYIKKANMLSFYFTGFTPLTILNFTGSILLIATVSYGQTYTVERVMDCNTFKLTNGEEVRLIGIDCPEYEKTVQEATEFVKDLIKVFEGKVRLEYDAQERDKYNRQLAYVYLFQCRPLCAIEAVYGQEYIELDDGWYVFVNATIIKSGYATPTSLSQEIETSPDQSVGMTVPPNVKYTDLFKELYEEARKEGRGLWAKEEDRKCTKENPCTNMPFLVAPEKDSYLEPIDCTMDVNECPDGNFVGRVPPNCEFKACPE